MVNKEVVILTNRTQPFAVDKLKSRYDLRERRSKTEPSVFNEWLSEAVGIFSSSHYILDDSILSKAPNLRVISQASMGYDNIDIESCTRRGIRVGHTPDVVTDSTADIGYGLILCSARQLHTAWEHVKKGIWAEKKPYSFGVDLKGKTLGIIGMGNIGLEIAKRALASKMKIIYNNRNIHQEADQIGARYVDRDTLLKTSDFVLTALPLNENTRHTMNKDAFAKMKSDARFINIARGGLVDSDALYEALKDNHIAYAALDVTEPEPIPKDHKLLTLDNIYISPHIGTATYETRDAMIEYALENLYLGLSGKNMLSCVNKELEK